MKVKLKTSISQLENSGKILTSRMDQVEDNLSGLEDKVEEFNYISKKYEKLNVHKGNMQE